jgi:hypothetical protein
MKARAAEARGLVKEGDTDLRRIELPELTAAIWSAIKVTPGRGGGVVSHLFNFRAVHHPAPGSYARAP